MEVAIQHEACLSAQHQTWRMPGFRKASTVSPSGPTLTRCSSSSLGTSPTNSSSHRGKGQTQDARAGSFGSHRLGRPMTQQVPGCANPPRPQILEPGELPEEEVRGTLGAQGLQVWPSRESWPRAGKILATFQVPSCSALPLRIRVCKSEKTREASFENFLSGTTSAPSWSASWAGTTLPKEDQRGTMIARCADSLGPGSPRPGSAP